MREIKIYHNPNFLSYQGNHAQIPLVNQLVATVTLADELPTPQSLHIAFAQTQHLDAPWYHNLGVLPHLRSTSVGDLLADDNGRFFVVERCGFQPYQPPSLPWPAAQPGDLVGHQDTGVYRVIARRLSPKFRAQRLTAVIPHAQIWIDGARSWAVLVPITEPIP